MYCVDVPLDAASGLFMFTLPPKRGTTRKQKLIKKAEFAVQIDEVVSQLLDVHCPLQVRRRFVSTHRDARWLPTAAKDAKRERRRLERRWRSTHCADDYTAYRKSCRKANEAIVESRGQFYSDKIEAAANDSRRRWSAIRDVLHQTTDRELRSEQESAQLCNGFSTFFVDKIRKIKVAIKVRLGDSSDDAALVRLPTHWTTTYRRSDADYAGGLQAHILDACKVITT